MCFKHVGLKFTKCRRTSTKSNIALIATPNWENRESKIQSTYQIMFSESWGLTSKKKKHLKQFHERNGHIILKLSSSTHILFNSKSTVNFNHRYPTQKYRNVTVASIVIWRRFFDRYCFSWIPKWLKRRKNKIIQGTILNSASGGN